MFCFGTLLEGEPLLDAEGSDDIAEDIKISDDVVNSIQRAYALSSNNDTKNLLFDILTQVSDFCQSHPLYSITGRMFIYKNNCEEFPDGLCIIKEYISHEDFVLSLQVVPIQLTILHKQDDSKRNQVMLNVYFLLTAFTLQQKSVWIIVEGLLLSLSKKNVPSIYIWLFLVACSCSNHP